MLMDPTWLFLSMIVGGIGFVLFVYGKKQQRWPQLVAGVLLMVYPYFTPGVPALCGVGAAILLGVWITVRQGW